MTSLRAFQDRFQKAILEKDDSVLVEIPDSPREKRDVLLGVYRNAYSLRLIEFLQNDYEKLNIYLGEQQFGNMARDYIKANPSLNQNGRWFGTKLPEFLQNAKPYSDTPELFELALLERMLNDVFDAAEAPELSVNDLSEISPDEWATLQFQIQPATMLYEFKTNVVDIWTALHRNETPPTAAVCDEVIRVLVYRQDNQSMFRIAGYEEAMMWREASKGASFGVLCEMIATYGGNEDASLRAAQYLQGWINTGLLKKPA